MQLGLTQKARTRSCEELKASATFIQSMSVKLCPLPPRSSKQACGHRAVTIPEEHSLFLPSRTTWHAGARTPVQMGRVGTWKGHTALHGTGVHSSTGGSCPTSQGPSSCPSRLCTSTQASQLCSSSLWLPTLVAARRFPNSTAPLKSSPCSSSVQYQPAPEAGEPFHGSSEAGRRRGPQPSSCSSRVNNASPEPDVMEQCPESVVLTMFAEPQPQLTHPRGIIGFIWYVTTF